MQRRVYYQNCTNDHMSNTKKSNEEMDGKKNDTELAGDDETPSPETAVVTPTSTSLYTFFVGAQKETLPVEPK